MSDIKRREFLKVAALASGNIPFGSSRDRWKEAVLPTNLSEIPPAHRPVLGAEVIDELNATDDRVNGWFKLLADNQMVLARVFIPHEVTRLPSMDRFFRAAEKYHIGIIATLAGEPSTELAAWLEQVVKRYMNSPA